MEKKRNNCLLLHIPHSSAAFPAGTEYGFNDLDEEERLLIDYFTDELFAPEASAERICKLVFPYCRLYCDVERLVNDPLEKDGLGICYRRRVDGGSRSFGCLEEAFALYADFHAEASKQLVLLGDDTLLIDCHSFSSLPNLLNSNPPDIDVCIGFNDDETCPDLDVVGNVAQHFNRCGYKVGINKPFANSKTFAVPTKYHSIMIEVNKRLYMNEQTTERTEGFVKLRHDILHLYNKLLKP